MSNEKIYVGGAKAMNGNFGQFHKISFSQQDLDTMQSMINSKGYVNLVMNERRTPSQYGQTHSLTVDTWQPNQGNGGQGGAYQQPPQPYQQQPAPQYNQGGTVNGAPPQYQAPVNASVTSAIQDSQFRPTAAQVSELPNYDDVDDIDCPF